MKTYHPKIELNLVKVGKVGKKVKASTIDLTPYLGERGGVKTSKSIREPAGSFSIVLADQIYPEALDSLYGLIEPMDLIEIRFCHDAADKLYKDKNGGRPPIVMRGLVSEVRRDEAIGQDGKPARSVSIAGHDYGKLWQLFQIYYLRNVPAGLENLTQEYAFLQKYGEGVKYSTLMPVSDFLAEITKDLLNTYLGRLSWAKVADPSRRFVNEFKTRIVSSGTVNPYLLSNFNEFSLHQMLTSLLDVGAFNELYIEDVEDAVNIVLRPNQFCDLEKNGDLIQAQDDAPHMKKQTISGDDIQSISAARTDSHVANWFWVETPHWNLLRDMDYRINMAQTEIAYISKLRYENSAVDVYGFRKMTASIALGASTDPSKASGAKDADDLEKVSAFDRQYLNSRVALLGTMNKDNVVYESGMMKIRGNEKIRAGIQLEIQRGKMLPTCYVVRVEHEFMPFQGFWTTVAYERGTGFVDRQKTKTQYWEEMSGKGIEG